MESAKLTLAWVLTPANIVTAVEFTAISTPVWVVCESINRAFSRTESRRSGSASGKRGVPRYLCQGARGQDLQEKQSY